MVLSAIGKGGVGKGRWKFAMVFLGAANVLVESWHWSYGELAMLLYGAGNGLIGSWYWSLGIGKMSIF